MRARKIHCTTGGSGRPVASGLLLLALVLGLALPRRMLEKIYRANFERLYGTAPRPLNREAAIAELERMAGVIDAHAHLGFDAALFYFEPTRKMKQLIYRSSGLLFSAVLLAGALS